MLNLDYTFTDGGGDHNITNLAVQKAIIALFLKLYLDEVIFVHTAAITPHVAMMRSSMDKGEEKNKKIQR